MTSLQLLYMRSSVDGQDRWTKELLILCKRGQVILPAMPFSRQPVWPSIYRYRNQGLYCDTHAVTVYR